MSLIFVLLFLAPAPGREVTLIGIPPIFGLDPALGEPERAVGPLSAIWYVVFALPFFLYTRDVPRSRAPGALRLGLADLGRTISVAGQHRSLFAFLVASMVYRDALAALYAFGGIYAAGVLGWGAFQLGVFGIVAATVGTIGTYLAGRADERFGPRPVIVGSIWVLIAVGIFALLTTRTSVAGFAVARDSRLPDLAFLAAGGLLGAAGGAVQAASRTLLVHLAAGRVAPAQAFGLFALSGRATAFIGPAAIATVTTLSGSQRLGVSPVILLFLLGLGLLYWVKAEDEQPPVQPHRASHGPDRMIERLTAALFVAAVGLALALAGDRPQPRRRASTSRSPTARRCRRAMRSARPARAASPARSSCRRAARPGRRCGSAAITSGAIRR